jgi:hypothetical protein
MRSAGVFMPQIATPLSVSHDPQQQRPDGDDGGIGMATNDPVVMGVPAARWTQLPAGTGTQAPRPGRNWQLSDRPSRAVTIVAPNGVG